MTYGLSFWLPQHGVGSVSLAPYDFRSGMGSCFSLAIDYLSKDDAFWDQATTRINELLAIQSLFASDFYPLTEYSTAKDVWIAWQFHDPSSGKGFLQAFRRAESEQAEMRFRLKGLGSESRYRLTCLHEKNVATASGRVLLEKGWTVTITDAPGSCIWKIEGAY